MGIVSCYMVYDIVKDLKIKKEARPHDDAQIGNPPPSPLRHIFSSLLI